MPSGGVTAGPVGRGLSRAARPGAAGGTVIAAQKLTRRIAAEDPVGGAPPS